MDLRSRYEQAVRALSGEVDALRREGRSEEAIARTVHGKRRQLATDYKALTPEPYRSRIAARTLRVYGSADGPSIAFLRARGKSWAAIIEGATRPGPPVGLDPED